jgi:hypothetical protein
MTATDANGCSVTDSVFLSEPDSITFSADVTSTNIFNGFGVSCNGSSDGEITFSNVAGGTPNFEFSINNGFSYSSDSIFNNNGYLISANTYSLIVRDANLCTTNVVSVLVDEPVPFVVDAFTIPNQYGVVGVNCFGDNNGVIDVAYSQIDPTFLTLPMTFDLDGAIQFGATNTSFSNLLGELSYGYYTLTATNANGCQSIDY